MTFLEKLNSAVDKANSLLCVGLDPDHTKLSGINQFDFNKKIIDATAEFVCAFKPNTAFYEALGADGIEDLKRTCDYILQKFPDLPIILDAKRADIGNTNYGYTEFAFNYLKADAITLHPYLGGQSLEPFLEFKDKGFFILARTSNPGAGDLQDLEVSGQPLYLHVVTNAMKNWNKNGNVMFVAGATYPEELASVRKLAGEDVPILVPGIGAQGGDIAATCQAGLNTKGEGLIINSARTVIFSDNPASEAKKLRDEINRYRK